MKCVIPGCEEEAIECIMKWTDEEGSIVIERCRKHEEEFHPK